MSELFTSAAALVVTLGLLIAFHEFGHFWTARKLGVKVLRFSIGFGKPLWSRRAGSDDTEYAIAAIPLGGYVKMLDEREGPVPEAERDRAFNNQPVWSRIAIVAAGPVFNLVFAVIAFWLMYLIGVPGLKPLIGEVAADSIAANAGFHARDEIVAVGGEPTPTWSVAQLALLDEALSSDTVAITVRDADGRERRLQLPVAAISDEAKQRELLQQVGISPWRPRYPAVLGELSPDGAAQQAGLLSGDRILRIDGQPIADWAALVAFVRAHADATAEVEIARNGETLSLPLHIGSREAKSGRIGFIGAAPQVVGPPPAEMLTRQQYGPFTAIPHAVAKTWQLSSLTLRMIGKMLLGEVSVKNLSGPITIATYAGYTASAGITAFLYFLAVISISLGVLNLLPIPLLDGGHLMYYLIEIVRGRPLPEEVQMQLQRIGIAILGALMVLAFYNDLNRLWGG